MPSAAKDVRQQAPNSLRVKPGMMQPVKIHPIKLIGPISAFAVKDG